MSLRYQYQRHDSGGFRTFRPQQPPSERLTREMKWLGDAQHLHGLQPWVVLQDGELIATLMLTDTTGVDGTTRAEIGVHATIQPPSPTAADAFSTAVHQMLYRLHGQPPPAPPKLDLAEVDRFFPELIGDLLQLLEVGRPAPLPRPQNPKAIYYFSLALRALLAVAPDTPLHAFAGSAARELPAQDWLSRGISTFSPRVNATEPTGAQELRAVCSDLATFQRLYQVQPDPTVGVPLWIAGGQCVQRIAHTVTLDFAARRSVGRAQGRSGLRYVDQLMQRERRATALADARWSVQGGHLSLDSGTASLRCLLARLDAQSIEEVIQVLHEPHPAAVRLTAGALLPAAEGARLLAHLPIAQIPANRLRDCVRHAPDPLFHTIRQRPLAEQATQIRAMRSMLREIAEDTPLDMLRHAPDLLPPAQALLARALQIWPHDLAVPTRSPHALRPLDWQQLATWFLKTLPPEDRALAREQIETRMGSRLPAPQTARPPPTLHTPVQASAPRSQAEPPRSPEAWADWFERDHIGAMAAVPQEGPWDGWDILHRRSPSFSLWPNDALRAAPHLTRRFPTPEALLRNVPPYLHPLLVDRAAGWLDIDDALRVKRQHNMAKHPYIFVFSQGLDGRWNAGGRHYRFPQPVGLDLYLITTDPPPLEISTLPSSGQRLAARLKGTRGVALINQECGHLYRADDARIIRFGDDIVALLGDEADPAVFKRITEHFSPVTAQRLLFSSQRSAPLPAPQTPAPEASADPSPNPAIPRWAQWSRGLQIGQFLLMTVILVLLVRYRPTPQPEVTADTTPTLVTAASPCLLLAAQTRLLCQAASASDAPVSARFQAKMQALPDLSAREADAARAPVLRNLLGHLVLAELSGAAGQALLANPSEPYIGGSIAPSAAWVEVLLPALREDSAFQAISQSDAIDAAALLDELLPGDAQLPEQASVLAQKTQQQH